MARIVVSEVYWMALGSVFLLQLSKGELDFQGDAVAIDR